MNNGVQEENGQDPIGYPCTSNELYNWVASLFRLPTFSVEVGGSQLSSGQAYNDLTAEMGTFNTTVGPAIDAGVCSLPGGSIVFNGYGAIAGKHPFTGQKFSNAQRTELGVFAAVGGVVELGPIAGSFGSASDILMPGGVPIWTRVKGAGSEVGTVAGGPAKIQELFDALTVNGRVISQPSYSGTMVELENGDIVGYRISAEYGPTLDLKIQGIPILKLHAK
jgi:hypothetical protein